jgi:hypothetical protein
MMCSLHAARLQTCFHSAPQNGSATVLNTTSKNHQLQLVLCSSRNPLLPGFNSYFLMNCKILAFFLLPFRFFFLGAWGSSFTATPVAKKCRVVSPSLPSVSGACVCSSRELSRALSESGVALAFEWRVLASASFVHSSLTVPQSLCARCVPASLCGEVGPGYSPQVLSSSGAYVRFLSSLVICSFVRSLRSVHCLMSRLRLLRVQN